jgi:hypothetical protein
VKLLKLLHINVFEISAPQCPTHYSPAGNGDALNIVEHKNVRLSEVIVSDINAINMTCLHDKKHPTGDCDTCGITCAHTHAYQLIVYSL